MNTFSIYWSVGNVQHSKDFATRRNIKKAVLFPRYQGNVGDFDTVSAYIGSKEINPPSNLNIIRMEDSILENSRSIFSGNRSWTGKTNYVGARYFLLTDVVGNYISHTSEPFYWKHVLPSADIDPDSVAILDSNLVEVNSESYKSIRVEARDATDNIISGTYESCSIFSNYVNSYNKETGDFEIYFVRYSVSGSTHYQLLNPEPAFTEAGFDDISLVTGQLKPWRKVYIITTGSSLFTVTTPKSDVTYYLAPLEESRIVVRNPIDRSDQSPWFTNISNGSFTTIRNSQTFSYSIAEFDSQVFSPLYPYKLEADELAEQITPDILKVDRSYLKIDSSIYIMDILIKNAKGETLYALTTDASSDGEYYEESGGRVYRSIETDNAWVTWDSNGIASWDASNGFIHLQHEYPDTRYFYVTYYYKETGLEFTSLNVNPIFDEEYNDQFYVLYVVPIGGDNNNVGQTASVQYLKVDRSGRIIDTSQDGSGGNLDIASYINVGEQYMYYSLSASSDSSAINYTGQNYIDLADASDFPDSGILVWENLSGNLEYNSYNSISGNRISFESYTLTEDLPIGTTFRLHSFVTPFTTSNTSNSYQWLILSEVHVGSTSRVDELSIIDLRVPGGVIKDKYKESALAIDPRSIWARPETIHSRGQPIPGDSVAVIKVPYTLLKEFGGTFSHEQVEAIISERHLAVGVVPVIIYHGAIPNIESISSTTNSITVSWDSEGTSYSYNIYYSSVRDGPWTLASSSFEDQAYGNTYTISDLLSGLIYYVVVTSVNSDGIESPKSIPWGIKTRIS